jgi:hypothetical protein
MSIMSERAEQLYQHLFTDIDIMREHEEVSDDDCLEACAMMHGAFVASAPFVQGDSREQYEQRIALAKEALETIIRVQTIALIRAAHEPEP